MTELVARMSFETALSGAKSHMMRHQRSVAIVLFEGVNALDVTGPAEAFATARLSNGEAAYTIETYAIHDLQVRTESGLTLLSDRALEHATPSDLLIIPGGRGARSKLVLEQLVKWLKTNAHSYKKVASICTGAFPLACSGLVDGSSITTHWAHGTELQEICAKVQVKTEHLFLSEGKFYSSGGVASGIDLALEIIRQDLGHSAAMAVAREMVVFLRRDGGQSQFSNLLQLQTKANDRLRETCNWAAANLDADLSNEVLAERAGLSVRQFTRKFVNAIGEPPATHINRLRVEAAKSALAEGTNIASTAHAVGFGSTDGFRKSFEKLVGITPGQFQARFGQVRESL